MTRYEKGFLTKCAQQGLSESDTKALIDFVNQQAADREKKEEQKKVFRAANRAERVRTARLAMLGALGGVGALTGRIGGRLLGHSDKAEVLGMALGGLAGGVGGWMWGKSIGNRDADRQEKWEDMSGQDIASQNIQRAAQIAAWNSILNSGHPGRRAVFSRFGSPSRIL